MAMGGDERSTTSDCSHFFESPADDHRMRLPAHLPTRKGRITALGAELTGVDSPFRVRVDDRHVRVRARPKRTTVDAEHAGRVNSQFLDELRPGQVARF